MAVWRRVIIKSSDGESEIEEIISGANGISYGNHAENGASRRAGASHLSENGLGESAPGVVPFRKAE